MYSLIVTADETAWEQDSYDFDASRMFEHTTDNVRTRVQQDLRAAVMGHPVLFAYEGYIKKSARVGWIEAFNMSRSTAAITYRWDPSVEPIDYEVLNDLATKLGIGNWELNRTHWAFKDVDLGRVLAVNDLVQSNTEELLRTPLSSRVNWPQAAPTTRPISPSSFPLPAAVAIERPSGASSGELSPLKLSELMKGMQESVGATNALPAAALATPSLPTAPGLGVPPKVFIVHGRASDLQTEVALFLTRLGIEPIILHEQADQGRTIITKFEEVAEEVLFAVVLMTPDDEGGLVGTPVQKRARQNVIFEHGYFVAKLGAKRVCALVKGQIEKPSDISGVLYVEANESSHWKIRLARELKVAGIPADYSKVIDI